MLEYSVSQEFVCSWRSLDWTYHRGIHLGFGVSVVGCWDWRRSLEFRRRTTRALATLTLIRQTVNEKVIVALRGRSTHGRGSISLFSLLLWLIYYIFQLGKHSVNIIAVVSFLRSSQIIWRIINLSTVTVTALCNRTNLRIPFRIHNRRCLWISQVSSSRWRSKDTTCGRGSSIGYMTSWYVRQFVFGQIKEWKL